MNILYGKLGRAIIFDPSKWSTIGGDNEAPLLVLKMAELHPEDKFYLAQPSDFDKTNLHYKYPNIIPLFNGFNIDLDDHTYLLNKVKRLGIKIDYAIFYNGLIATNNIHGVYYKNKKLQMTHTKVLQFSKRYSSNQVHFINSYPGLKWMLLTPDPRYFPTSARDIFTKPEFILSQYTFLSDWVWREYLTRKDHFLPALSVYSGLENVYFFNKRKPPRDIYINHTTTYNFNIVMNQGGTQGGVDRYFPLKEYVLDNFPKEDVKNISIFGKWNEDVTAGDDRFKGEVRIEQLGKLLRNTLYTLVIPIDKDWATAKFAEMTHHGIIPFMHPTYDTQHNIKCPEFLRVSSPSEFKEKVYKLQNDRELVKQLRSELYDIYTEDIYSGKEFVENEVYYRIKKSLNNEIL